MLLESFTYHSKGWNLERLSLGKSNLIVGKNSSGKSRALQALKQVLSIISQSNTNKNNNFTTQLTLVEGGDRIMLKLSVDNSQIREEKLKVNDETLIHRTEQSAIISGETVNPPLICC